ncbi:MAG: dipeptide/oligopeptide/nickel ABC transporter ATP-binding protein [Lachnospiraceae bacterium]|nr:dipeptide/oligopeptide/nickel ABC transporter ATP-binding protein [Lachnospiraceae bacterium]
MSENLVELDDVMVSFRNKEVLKGISFAIRKGEILGLAGESGSGKSTIARTILGLLSPKAGTVTKHTAEPQMIFQDPYGSLNPAYSISWIMQEPLRLHTKLGAEERQKKVLEMLAEVGLPENVAGHKPAELSGGQRQRVCIGTALMRSPELLIADEPVSALDVTVAAQVLALLKRLHDEKGLSMLFISHDLRTMYHFCDRILILKDGKIIEEGVPAELYREPKEEYTKLLLQSAGIRKEQE